jgi:KaiC domain protein
MTLEKVSTGIDGLNTMLGGGIPKGQIIALLGSCGTGKTTMSLQFIWTGLKKGEKCIFISLEEDEEDITRNAMNYGWDLKPHLEDKTLTLVKLEPSDAKATLGRIRSELPTYIKSTGASRVVFDSISLLSMLFDSDPDRRSGLFELCKQMKNSGTTALFTAEVDPDNPNVSRDGLVEYVADGVILLRYNEVNNDIHLSVRIVKLRRSNHQRRIKPYNITARGIEVLDRAEVF